MIGSTNGSMANLEPNHNPKRLLSYLHVEHILNYDIFTSLYSFPPDKLYTGVADGRIVEVDLETLETNTIVERLGVPPCGKYIRADSRFAPGQWETALLCNDVSHWLGANLESALVHV